MNAVPKMQVINLDQFQKKKPTYSGEDRMLTMNEVIEKTGLSRATINRRIAANDFAPKYKFGAQCIRFLESELEAWIASKRGQNDKQ